MQLIGTDNKVCEGLAGQTGCEGCGTLICFEIKARGQETMQRTKTLLCLTAGESLQAELVRAGLAGQAGCIKKALL
jgi:hypothetical protein